MTEFIKISQELTFLDGQLANNWQVLSDPAKVRAQSAKLRGELDAFGKSTVGQDRAAEGALQAARFLRGQEQENVTVAANVAEAPLAASGGIDTTLTNATDAFLDVLTPTRRFDEGGTRARTGSTPRSSIT
jgi:hypothetical protein